MNVPKIRQNFPFFQRPSPQVYLDNAATTHKPAAVIEAITTFYGTNYGTVHRSLYPTGEAATGGYEQARETVAAFINATDSREVVFTKGATEGLNLVATSWALPNLTQDDEIVITAAEHHANLLPWQFVAQQTGAKLVIIPIDRTTYTLVNPISALTTKTKLVAITHDSNVLGPIWDHQTNELITFIQRAKSLGAAVLLDASQSVMHQRLDVQALGIDFMVFSGHKLLGPTGIGVLYLKQTIADQCQPYQRGGGMVRDVSYTTAHWLEAPHKFEAGTPPIAQAIGLAAAINFITSNIDFVALRKHETALCTTLLDGLETIAGIAAVGNQERMRHHSHIVCIAVANMHPHDLAAHLGGNGFAVRAGHHCAQPLVTALGFESLLRASVALYNTQAEIELFITQLQESVTWMTKMMR